MAGERHGHGMLCVNRPLLYCMEQSPSSEANRFSASQETPRILWNPKVHYRIHKCPPPVPILSQLYLIHASTSHSLKILISSYLRLGLPSGPFTSGFPNKSLYTPLFSPFSLHDIPISFSIFSPAQY